MLTAPWDPSSYLAQMHQLQQFQEAQVNTPYHASQSNYAHHYGF